MFQNFERYHFCHTVMVYCIFLLVLVVLLEREELILSAALPGASWRRWKLWQLVPYLYYTWTPISHRAITTTKSAPGRWDSRTSQLFNHYTLPSRSTNIIELITPRQKFSKIVSFLTREKSEISKKNRIYETWWTRYIKIQLKLTSSLKMFTNCSLRKFTSALPIMLLPTSWNFFRNPETEISEIQKDKTNLTIRSLNLLEFEF